MIALQVVRTSFGFHLREYVGSCPPPPPPPLEVTLDETAFRLIHEGAESILEKRAEKRNRQNILTPTPRVAQCHRYAHKLGISSVVPH